MAQITLQNALDYSYRVNFPIRKAADPDVHYAVGEKVHYEDLEAMGAAKVLYLLEANTLLLEGEPVTADVTNPEPEPDEIPEPDSEDDAIDSSDPEED